jgi:hypothetical protein
LRAQIPKGQKNFIRNINGIDPFKQALQKHAVASGSF